MPSDGGTPRQITNTDSNGWFPSWSPDGREIVFWESNQGIWVVPSAGGEARQLLTYGFRPNWSPDGEWIVLDANEGDGGPQRIRPSGEGKTPLPMGPGSAEQRRRGRYYGWTPDSESVFYNDGDIWVASIDTGTERRLTDLAGRDGRLEVQSTTDGKYMYFTWREDVGDVWVMDVVTE